MGAAKELMLLVGQRRTGFNQVNGTEAIDKTGEVLQRLEEKGSEKTTFS